MVGDERACATDSFGATSMTGLNSLRDKENTDTRAKEQANIYLSNMQESRIKNKNWECFQFKKPKSIYIYIYIYISVTFGNRSKVDVSKKVDSYIEENVPP